MDSEVPAKKARTKPKVANDWQEEETFLLIRLVDEEPCLWDAGNPNYHNKSSCDCLWSLIEEYFREKFGKSELCAKWTNLRIQYRGYAARNKSKSGQAPTDIPKWKFYAAMSFVGRAELQQTQPTTSNFNLDTTNNDTATNPIEEPSLRRLQQQPTSGAQIAESMRQAVAALQERKQSAAHVNSVFGNYIATELGLLDVEVAARVRSQLLISFVQFIEEAKK